MSKSAEEKARALLNSDMAKGLDMDKLSAIMNGPVGKALQRQFSGPKGEKLRQTASEAADGNTAAVSQMISELMSTQEGKTLAEQVMEMNRKKS